MATAVEQLLVRLDATSEQLRREVAKADSTVADFARKTDRHTKAVDAAMGRLNRSAGVATKALGAFGVALSVGALTSFAKSNVAAADSLVKTADRLGVTIEALQEYRFAAERSGVATNDADKALEQFTRRLGQAQAGTGTFLPVLTKAGIALRDAAGHARTSEEVLAEFADAMAAAATPAERMRLATEAFGRSGAGMVNVLRGGSAGLADFARQANDAGVVLGGDLARRAEELNDRIAILGERAATAGQAFTLAMAPALESAIGVFERLSMAVANAAGGLAPTQFVFGDELEHARQRAEALRVEMKSLEDVAGRSATRRRAELKADINALESVDAYRERERILARIVELQAESNSGRRARGKGANNDNAEKIVELEAQLASVQKFINAAERAQTTIDDVVLTAGAAVNDNLSGLGLQLDKARQAFDALANGGVEAFDRISAGFDLDERAAAAAEAFNAANEKLIESGQTQARTAADYRDVLGEIADLQDRTTDRQALDQYLASLGDENRLARLRLEVGEDEARVRAEILAMRRRGIAISDAEEAAILDTAAATAKLTAEWEAQNAAQTEAVRAAEKAAEETAEAAAETLRRIADDASRSCDEIPDEYAGKFNALCEEALQ